MLDEESTANDKPSVIMIRSPPASCFSSDKTWARAASRTSIQHVESARSSFVLLLPSTTLSYQDCIEVLSEDEESTLWIGGCRTTCELIEIQIEMRDNHPEDLKSRTQVNSMKNGSYERRSSQMEGLKPSSPTVSPFYAVHNIPKRLHMVSTSESVHA